MTWVTRGDGTKGKGGGEKILAHGTDRTNHQLKVVQEFLADLKRALKALWNESGRLLAKTLKWLT